MQMLLCELLQRANPTQLLLKTIMRRPVWEWPTHGSGFENPLSFCVAFRCGHVDRPLQRCYKLLIIWAKTSVPNIPGTPLARISLCHYQCVRGQFSKEGSAFPSTAELDQPDHPAKRVCVSCPCPAEQTNSCGSCWRREGVLHRDASQRADLQSSSLVSPGLLFLCLFFTAT